MRLTRFSAHGNWSSARHDHGGRGIGAASGGPKSRYLLGQPLRLVVGDEGPAVPDLD